MKKNMIEKKARMIIVLTLAGSIFGTAGIARSDEGNITENREAADIPIATLPADGAVTIMPEISQPVELSSSDVNRITCQGEIKDVVYSKEKGITVKFSGRDAFIKFRIGQKDGKTAYSTTPSEIFIVCGDNIYSLIAVPKRIPARSVRLSPGEIENVRKNRLLLGALPFEKKALTVIKSLFTDEIPESFTVSTPKRKIDLFRDLDLVLSRIAVAEGEGIQVKEYRGTIAGGDKDKIELGEKDFLRNEISTDPIAVSLDRFVLKKGEILRIFVVEPHREEPGDER
ncbi:MAG: type-F conjugative transfer system secretin TraK [Syntrophales bacterium]|jgi:conjugal transfer pilus assembly protein TraK|nr:type-F conjugative transfer system secretin TraK [Syntrophales bacterium]